MRRPFNHKFGSFPAFDSTPFRAFQTFKFFIPFVASVFVFAFVAQFVRSSEAD